MITITYRPKKREVKIKGHAEYDEKGRDIVCAAVSMSFYTLSNALLKAPDKWFKKPPDMADSLTSDTGVSHIVCTPNKDYETYVTLMYETVLTGLELLERSYPDHVKLRIVRE